MEQNILEKQRELTQRLNRFRAEYYSQNAPSVSDAVYDRLFDELKELEQQTGVCMANSPTQTVGYPTVSRLEKNVDKLQDFYEHGRDVMREQYDGLLEYLAR